MRFLSTLEHLGQGLVLQLRVAELDVLVGVPGDAPAVQGDPGGVTPPRGVVVESEGVWEITASTSEVSST